MNRPPTSPVLARSTNLAPCCVRTPSAGAWPWRSKWCYSSTEPRAWPNMGRLCFPSGPPDRGLLSCARTRRPSVGGVAGQSRAPRLQKATRTLGAKTTQRSGGATDCTSPSGVCRQSPSPSRRKGIGLLHQQCPAHAVWHLPPSGLLHWLRGDRSRLQDGDRRSVQAVGHVLGRTGRRERPGAALYPEQSPAWRVLEGPAQQLTPLATTA